MQRRRRGRRVRLTAAVAAAVAAGGKETAGGGGEGGEDGQGGAAAAPFAGVHVVVTGTVPGMTREQAFEAVEAAGGTAQKTVSGKTDLLVFGDGAGRRKAEAAAEKGVRVIDAAAFLRILAGDEKV